MTTKWVLALIGGVSGVLLATTLVRSADLQPMIVTDLGGTLRIQQGVPCADDVDRAALVGIPAVVFMANNLGSDGNGAVAGTTASAAAGMSTMQSKQPVVAYVRDAAKGEVVVMSGVSEVVITDKKLVAQLLGVVEG